jgi:flagellar biosynthesis protein FliR
MVLTVGQIEVFFFILARLAGLFIQAPLFNSRSFFMFGKVAFALWLTIILWFVAPVSRALPETLPAFVFTLVSEIAVGYLIGFICNVLFLAIQSAGEIMDMQMGLSVAQALDPLFGAVVSVVGRLTFYFALIVFIALDGHHLLLAALHNSFTLLPAGQIANFGSAALVDQLMSVCAALWLSAIKIAAPIVLLIFLADFTFGIVSRVAPQVNVFMLGFQVKPVLGLFAFSLLTPFIVKYIGNLTETMGSEILKLLTAIK